MFGFEKVDVWRKAIDWADNLYTATDNLPKDELFGLRSQFRRSAVSVAANISERAGRNSDKEFVRFLQIAYGSLMETVSHLTIAKRRNFLNEATHTELYSRAEELAKMLSGLRTSITNRANIS